MKYYIQVLVSYQCRKLYFYGVVRFCTTDHVAFCSFVLKCYIHYLEANRISLYRKTLNHGTQLGLTVLQDIIIPLAQCLRIIGYSLNAVV